MFLGLDSSTQSLTAVLIDPDKGEIVHTESVNFGAVFPQYGSPNGFLPTGKNGEVHSDPRMWLEALDMLFAALAKNTDLSKVKAVSASGQQHGSVYLDDSFEQRLATLDPQRELVDGISPAFTRGTAPIWMDTSTTEECEEITVALGGREYVCRRSGSIPIERFTGPQIRRFFKHSPTAYDRTARIHLVSSFVASILAGKSVAIDHGDGAGMNLMNLESLDWDPELLDATAPDLAAKLPPLAPSATIAGPIAGYFVEKYGIAATCQVALSTGDNPSSLVGMGASAPGKVVISLGTSDTMFAAMPGPRTDPQGFGHVFGNPTGGFMSLICFRNGSLAREALKDQLGLDWKTFDNDCLTETRNGNQGNVMLPFYGPEITPRRDFDGPVRRGTPDFEAGKGAPIQVRALLEGQFLNMKLHSQWMDLEITTIRLTGGASKSDGIAQLIANIFQAPVERLAVADGAALGAALRAAHACGLDLENLYATFSAPDPGSHLDPDPNARAIYQTLLTDYAELLKA